MWSSFYSGVEKSVASATPAGDFGIGPEQLVLMSKDHNVSSLKQYGGVSCVVSLVDFLYLIFSWSELICWWEIASGSRAV